MLHRIHASILASAAITGAECNPPLDDGGTMSHLPTVREYMDRHVQTLSPDTDIMDAVDFLLERRVTGALVVNARGQLVGILTELDCLRLLTHGDESGEAPQGKVSDFMTREVRTIPPTMDVYYCAGLFAKVAFRRFAVVEDGRLVGAITRFDLLRAVRSGLSRIPVRYNR
jgi:CBS domain-containing protein